MRILRIKFFREIEFHNTIEHNITYICIITKLHGDGEVMFTCERAVWYIIIYLI